MEQLDFNALASDAMQGMLDKGYLADAVHARKQDDFQTLSYYIARGLKYDFQTGIKFGIIFAVCDAIDAMEAV